MQVVKPALCRAAGSEAELSRYDEVNDPDEVCTAEVRSEERVEPRRQVSIACKEDQTNTACIARRTTRAVDDWQTGDDGNRTLMYSTSGSRIFPCLATASETPRTKWGRFAARWFCVVESKKHSAKCWSETRVAFEKAAKRGSNPLDLSVVPCTPSRQPSVFRCVVINEVVMQKTRSTKL